MALRSVPHASEFRVEVTSSAPGQPHGMKVQQFNCADLDAMWRTVSKWRGETATRRVRVYSLLAVFEV